MSTPRTARPAAVATATALGGLAALHALWATGSTFPLRDGDEFVETVIGTDGGRVPGAGACLAVAGALSAAAGAALVRGTRSPADAGSTLARLASLGVRGAAAALGARGLAGLVASSTGLRPASERFRSLDLAVYSPLCLALAGGLVTVERRASAGS
ncbi:uncharacterized protein DUF3995 [Flavimobilis soli]|uniref:Uncharacterized protein DUF3995 n=1 Tax=Flavimobilis soli TaxID=442709 RepID=A0A2A9ECD7_9MICO|nr:DUF3995 domain-containing protein [Flavimobilis soli]PFG36463.1 uncharacterized protein DUF3995 [Flavimobilis soli]